jgi:hypothetical protein
MWRTSKLNLCISYVEVGSCENKDGGSDVSVFMCKVNLIDHTSSPHSREYQSAECHSDVELMFLEELTKYCTTTYVN